jgi:hypothetical protein
VDQPVREASVQKLRAAVSKRLHVLPREAWGRSKPAVIRWYRGIHNDISAEADEMGADVILLIEVGEFLTIRQLVYVLHALKDSLLDLQ